MVDPTFPGTPCDCNDGIRPLHDGPCEDFCHLDHELCEDCVGGVVPLPVIVPMMNGEPDPAWMVYDQPCDTCDGTGSLDVTDFDDLGSDEIEIDSESCEDCDGTGEVRRTAPVVTDCPEPGCGEHELGHVAIEYEDTEDEGSVAIIDLCPECDGEGEIVVGNVPWTVAPVMEDQWPGPWGEFTPGQFVALPDTESP